MAESISKELLLKTAKVKKSISVILSERDIEILEFVLEMKFASLKNIFERFFKYTLSGVEARSDEWAVRRIQQLTKAGYLEGTHSFYERRKYYLATKNAYLAVCTVKPEKDILRPSVGIDQSTFNHDKLVVNSRIILENQKAATNWISDKKLRANKDLAGGLISHNVPDAIYIDESGARVAFEMELSQKSKSDYSTKIKRYVSIMRNQNDKTRVVDKVIYICSKLGIYEFLAKETKIYGDLFEVKKLSDFLPKVNVENAKSL